MGLRAPQTFPIKGGRVTKAGYTRGIYDAAISPLVTAAIFFPLCLPSASLGDDLCVLLGQKQLARLDRGTIMFCHVSYSLV